MPPLPGGWVLSLCFCLICNNTPMGLVLSPGQRQVRDGSEQRGCVNSGLVVRPGHMLL